MLALTMGMAEELKMTMTTHLWVDTILRITVLKITTMFLITICLLLILVLLLIGVPGLNVQLLVEMVLGWSKNDFVHVTNQD